MTEEGTFYQKQNIISNLIDTNIHKQYFCCFFTGHSEHVHDMAYKHSDSHNFTHNNNLNKEITSVVYVTVLCNLILLSAQAG